MEAAVAAMRNGDMHQHNSNNSRTKRTEKNI